MATLVGEAAVRIVPSVRNFKSRTESELKALSIKSVAVEIKPNLTRAEAELDAWRAAQERRAVNLRVKTDLDGLKRELSQVEHIFERNSLSRAIRFNIVVAGLDALPALAYAAGSAASGLDALGKSAFALPGLLGGVLASVGALATGMHGLKGAFEGYKKDSDDHVKNARQQQDANRDLSKSYRDYQNAVRDTIREIQDLNAENRRSSLNVADAVLSVQEAADRLRQGGQRSLTELQRDQLSYLQSIDHLQEVMTKTGRVAQDTAEANAKGVAGADKVADALDQIAKNTEKLNESKITAAGEALAKLSPNARATVEAIHGLSGAWTQLQQSVQDNLFAGIDKTVTDLGQRALPGLEVGLSRVASGLNANFRSIGESLGSDKNQSFMTRIFGNTDEALQKISRGMNPLIEGFLRLTGASSNFLPRLGKAADKVFNRFNDFTKRIDADGSLNRWIDSGLKALTALGNTVINIGSIISSVSKAFDTASGHTGGFIKTLDDATKKLADLLKSTKGQGDLIGYFSRAREFINDIRHSLGDMRPLLHDVIGASREWSRWLLSALGALSQIASWVDRNTGLLKYMVLGFAAFRTMKPVVDGLTNAWSAYDKVINALARNSTFGPMFDKQAAQLRQFKGHVDEAGTSVGRFAVVADSNGRPALKRIADEADTAGEKIGGQGKASMRSKIGLLAGALAPGAALMIGIPLAMAAINKLGEAHRNAAADAEKQTRSLEALAGQLDSTTGAFNRSTASETAKQLGGYSIPGIGNRNIRDDLRKTGVATPEQLVQASNPINSAQRDDYLAKLDKQTADKISQSEEWKRFQPLWEKEGVDLQTLAKAVNGDPGAKAKVEGVINKLAPTAGAPDWLVQMDRADKHTRGNLPGSLTDTLKSAGAYESASSAIFLRDTSGKFISQGNEIKEATKAAGGAATIKPFRQGAFPFGGLETSIDPATGQGVVQFDGPLPPGWAENLSKSGNGEVQEISPNRFQVRLSPDATKRDLDAPGFRDGGLITGRGGPRDDLVHIKASPGEHITNADAVNYYGRSTFDALNAKAIPRFDTGGWFGPIKPVVPSPIQMDVPTFGGASGRASAPAPIAPQKSAAPAPAPKPNAWQRFWNWAKPQNFGETNIGVYSTKGSAWDAMQTPAPKPVEPKIPIDPGKYNQPGDIKGFPTPPGLGIKPGSGFGSLPSPFLGRNVPDLTPPAVTAASSPSAAPSGAPASTHSGQGAAPGPSLGDSTRPVSGLPSGSPSGGHGTPTLAAASPNLGFTPGVPGLNAGAPLAPSRFSEQGLQRNTARGLRAIAAAFPEIQNIGGVRDDALRWHPDGLALDVMIPGQGGNNDPTTPEGLAEGNKILAWINQNKAALGVDYTMWQEKDHFNHIHVNFAESGYPAAGEQFTDPGFSGVPGVAGNPLLSLLAARGGAGVGGNPLAGFPGVPGGGGGLNLLGGLPKNLNPVDIAGQLGQIALQAVGGFFGLDLSYLTDAQQVANFYLTGGKSGGGGGGGGGLFGGGGEGSSFMSLLTGVGGAGNSIAGQAMSGYVNGQLPLDDPQLQQMLAESGFNPNIGTFSNIAGAGGAGGGGGEQWRPLVRNILRSVGPQYGISTPQALQSWEDAIVKQISTESGGDPMSRNDNDSNGQGGTQSVGGLLNFLPSTFQANNILGGSFNDPSSQIAAAIPYVINKWGIGADGSPNQIGRGSGFASGGFGSGSIRVSPGEYRTNPDATSFYGPAIFNALNGKKIPRSVMDSAVSRGFRNGGFPAGLPRFDGGGFPFPWIPQGPMPGQSQGPLPSQPPPQPAVGAPGGPGGPQGGPPPPDGMPPPGLPGVGSAPSTGGPPGSGATAPAPDPGALPGVADQLTNIGGAGAALGQDAALGAAQPGASDTSQPDPRATLGAAPTSQEHNNPAVSSAIQGAAGAIGSIAGMAAQLGITAAAAGGSFGAGAPAGAAAGGLANQGIQAGAQLAGQVGSGLVNILSSLMVGTLTGGSTGPASGIPLLPQRPETQTGVAPMMQRVHNGDINVTNLDEYKRQQQTMDAQQAMPFIGKY